MTWRVISKKLQIDKDSLTAAADDFADQAEKQHKLTLISKSNAMRKSSREKEAELNAVEQQLQDKLLQLSNEWINMLKSRKCRYCK